VDQGDERHRIETKLCVEHELAEQASR
jgi:hypothetical protein